MSLRVPTPALLALALVASCALTVPAAEQGGANPTRRGPAWRMATPVPGFRTRAPLYAHPPLEEMLAERSSAPASTESEPKRPTSVVPAPPYPARYGQVIRRYFELIRGLQPASLPNAEP